MATRPPATADRRRRSAPQALMREQLANGPAPGERVIAAAAEVDVSERSQIAAADALGAHI